MVSNVIFLQMQRCLLTIHIDHICVALELWEQDVERVGGDSERGTVEQGLKRLVQMQSPDRRAGGLSFGGDPLRPYA